MRDDGFDRDVAFRLETLLSHGVELDKELLALKHRMKVINDRLSAVTALQAATRVTAAYVKQTEATLRSVQERLPQMARSESIDRINLRLKNMPFEDYAQRKRA